MKRIDSEFLDANGNGHDVDNGIGCADFMEVNLFDRDTVNFRFRFGEAGEDVGTDFFYFRIEFAALDQVADLFPRTR